MQARAAKFHSAEASRKALYNALREHDTAGTLVIPETVLAYQYHLCTAAPFIAGNVKPDQVCRLSEWQRLVLMRTLTLALISVHRAGVVHCDLKPDNVLIHQNPDNGSCALKLIDFDGSFIVSDPPEDISGDPAYFAPEAYAMPNVPGIRLNQKIDIFALGIIFHYYWTGRFPVRDSDSTVGQSVLRGSRPAPDPSVPAPLRSIIERALEADPEKRIDAETVYAELGKMLSAYPVRIFNLQEPGKEAGKADSSAGGTEKAAHALSIAVIHYDTRGKIIDSGKIEVEYGKTETVCARTIPGYRLAGGEKAIRVSVDKDGYASVSPVRFTYKKEKSGMARFLGWAAALIAVYMIAVYGFALSSIGNGNYSMAAQYIRFAPFFSSVFPEQYDTVMNENSEELLFSRSGQSRYSGSAASAPDGPAAPEASFFSF